MTTKRCPIGSYGAHTYNAENDECIWCGPNSLAWRPGHWVQVESIEGHPEILPHSAWSATEPYEFNLDKELVK